MLRGERRLTRRYTILNVLRPVLFADAEKASVAVKEHYPLEKMMTAMCAEGVRPGPATHSGSTQLKAAEIA